MASKKYTSDLKQIGLPADDIQRLEDLVETDVEWFTYEQDVYRFAVALAIGKGIDIPSDKLDEILTDCAGNEGRKWRAQDDDQGAGIDGEDSFIRDIVTVFCPDEAKEYGPYRYSQALAHRGVQILHNELYTKRLDLKELLEPLYAEG